MHWEIWDAESGNQIGQWPTELQALEIVQDMLDGGWKLEEIAVCGGRDVAGEGPLPPALYGDALTERLKAFGLEVGS